MTTNPDTTTVYCCQSRYAFYAFAVPLHSRPLMGMSHVTLRPILQTMTVEEFKKEADKRGVPKQRESLQLLGMS